MGKGAGRGRKGGPTGRRQFSSVDDMKSGQVTEPAWKARRNRDEDKDKEDEEEEEEEEEDEEDDDKEKKGKGVAGLIEIQNPNAPTKASIKASQANMDAGPTQLSRREREELEKQRARERYLKLQAEGKTEQAQKDLERLAIIRKQREDAAKKREEERVAKEAKKNEGRK